MNAAEILERVKEHEAELVVRDDRLVLRGKGASLPEKLQAAVREHRAELMIALGLPFDRTVAAILSELRPHLPPTLRNAPHGDLLVLVNWSIMAAWEKTILKAGQQFDR